MSWIVGVLQPGGLTKATEHLERQSFEVYSPRLYCDFERKVVPLFPGYLLVKLVDRWGPVLGTRGVASVLMVAGKPGVVEDYEIDRIRSAEGPDGLVRAQRIDAAPRFRPGQRVRLLPRARLAGNQGSTVKFQSEDEAFSNVLMRLLGRYIPLKVRTEDLVAL